MRTVQRSVWRTLVAFAIVFTQVLSVSVSRAITLPAGFVESLYVGSLSSGAAMQFAPDGRLFVAQQNGNLRVIKNGTLLTTPFLSVTVDSAGERGLLGIAFDPNFAVNQYMYIYYTQPGTPPRNKITRWTANGDVAVAGSEVLIMQMDDLSGATNHNGGAIHFGPDGKLYAAVGDNANSANSQSFTTRHGKILRINADGTIPTDNPFFGTTTGDNRAIWALGLRNPFTFNFQPGTGRIYINDVGAGSWEEVNEGGAGINYGWPATEGYFNPTQFPQYRNPVYAYSHVTGQSDPIGCAVTGGVFYNPAALAFPASYVGKYFFSDYCFNWIYTLDPTAATPATTLTPFATGTSGSSIVDVKIGPDGALYYLARGGINGAGVYRIQYTANVPPTIAQHPVGVTRSEGQTATFTCSATGTPPLNYQWQRNETNITNANATSYTTPTLTLADNGTRFRCVVSNTFGTVTSNTAILTVSANQPPVASITQPTNGSLYSGGETINYAGTGSDAEDGSVPASRFTWEVVFHHDTHTHPFLGPISGQTGGAFVIPTQGETSDNVWYRIYLTVTDSQGASHTVFRDILPRKSTITLRSVPDGLLLTLDGQPIAAGTAVQSVVGIQRTLGVITPQVKGNTRYAFANWTHGGAATQTISTPGVNTTYTANFAASGNVDTVGIFRPSAARFFLRNSNSGGFANLEVQFGISSDVPLVGDWNGDGMDSVGVFRPATREFFLSDSNGASAPVNYAFIYGTAGDVPVVGDWDGNGKDSIGVYRTGVFYLRNTLDTGFADIAITFGIAGDVPLIGDWNGDSKDSPGLYRPSNGTFFLTNQGTSGNAIASAAFVYGILGDTPFIGDWDGDGVSGVAVYRTSSGLTYLRNALSAGFADLDFFYGTTNDKPLAGHWTLTPAGPAALPSPEVAPTFAP